MRFPIRHSLVLASLLHVAFACGAREAASPEPATPELADELPVCAEAGDLQRLDSQRVRLVGTYRGAGTVTKMNRPPEHLGYAVIEIEGKPSDYDPKAWDGQPPQVHLGTEIRPDGELRGFDGRQVSVVGRLALQPEEPEAELDAARPLPEPTLLDPEAVVLTEPRSKGR